MRVSALTHAITHAMIVCAAIIPNPHFLLRSVAWALGLALGWALFDWLKRSSKMQLAASTPQSRAPAPSWSQGPWVEAPCRPIEP